MGFPENLELENIKTLGLQLVTNLTKQLEGNIKLKQEERNLLQIKFKEEACQ